VRENPCERTVRRAQQDAGGFGVEPPDRKKTPMLWQQVRNCFPTVLIAHCRDDARGFVQDQRQLIFKLIVAYPLTVDGDCIFRRIDGITDPCSPPIDCNFAGSDEVICSSARCDTALGEEFVEPDFQGLIVLVATS